MENCEDFVLKGSRITGAIQTDHVGGKNYESRMYAHCNILEG